MLFFPFSAGSSASSTGADASLTTVRNFIKDALREIAALGEHQPLTPENAQLGLRYFQAMTRLFQGDGYLLYTVRRRPFVLVAHQQTYTVGQTGCDFTAPRPLVGVGGLGITPAGDDVEQPLDLYTREAWFAEPLKTLTDQWPRRVLYEPNDADTGTFTFWPTPTTAPTFAYATGEPLPSPEALETELLFPPGGYEEAWRLQLACRLRRPFGKPVTRDLNEDADLALGAVRRVNDPGPPVQTIDCALTQPGGYDIRSNRTK